MSLSNQPGLPRYRQQPGDGLRRAADPGRLLRQRSLRRSQRALVSKLPGAYSLVLNVGERFSDYSTFGTKYDGKYDLEYRPIQDLLLRASYANVFRTPTISDLFGGTAVNAAPDKRSLRWHQHPLAAAAKNPACAGIVPDPRARPTPSPLMASSTSAIRPIRSWRLEKGFTTNFGLVYNPSFYKPVTFNVDFWKYSIREAIAHDQVPELPGSVL